MEGEKTVGEGTVHAHRPVRGATEEVNIQRGWVEIAK